MSNILINLAEQTLQLSSATTRQYIVSTAKKGAGEIIDSNQTPRGRHLVHAKIGDDSPSNTVFRGRKPTGEIYTPNLALSLPQRTDWILTRILWLSGCEDGKNLGGDVDTLSRYIYIHGAPDTAVMGYPGSIGCIRMRNCDIIELYNLVETGMTVDIVEASTTKT